jgi:EAL domain-containing protein (putative c-di-GMP-specific phosphodiesterase class I)
MNQNHGMKTATKNDNWFLSGQLSDQDPLRQFTINTRVFTVGRRTNNALCLPVNSVSGCHAELEQRDAQLFLRDLGSTNGTYVNGKQLKGEIEVFEGDLIQFATLVFRLDRARDHSECQTIHEETGDRALAMMQFDRLINDGNVFPYYQPIVKLDDRSIIGYESLGRSRLFGLQMPHEMFHAASQLNLEAELSEVFRNRGVEVGDAFEPHINIFVNTHPKELGNDRLYESLRQIRKISQNRPVTLEIHEAATTDLEMMRDLCSVLADLNIQLAFDDFGVGRARLVELAEIRPDYLKFDMKLTQNIHDASSKRQEVVALFAKMVNDLGIQTLAEGVETEESHRILCEMGFKLGQGYLYGRPRPISKILKGQAGTDTDSNGMTTTREFDDTLRE